MARPLNIKLVVVGDGGVGKTCLLISYSYKRFPKEYVPTVFDNWDTHLKVEGQLIKLDLWDTAGQEDYDRLRPLSYPQTDVFLVCYSVISPVSYKHARDKWVPEIKHHCPDAAFILVGTKIDLRDDKEVKFDLTKRGESPVRKDEGEKLASKLKAHCYMECSALTQQGLHKIFDESIRAVIQPEKTSKKKFACGLL